MGAEYAVVHTPLPGGPLGGGWENAAPLILSTPWVVAFSGRAPSMGTALCAW